MIYPEIFITGKTGITNEALLCAIAFEGWACCMAGTKQPDNFGVGMAAISDILGIVCTPDELDKFAKEKGFL